MKIVDIFGDGIRFPNGWHRYIVTHEGTKWVRLMSPISMRTKRYKKSTYQGLTIKEPEQNWPWYQKYFKERVLLAEEKGKHVSSEVQNVLDYIDGTEINS